MTKKKKPENILKPSGGPPKVIDWKIVEALCKAQCPQAQLAQILGCAVPTLIAAVERTYGCTWAEYYEHHRQAGLGSLRMAQFETALDGNATMQIWLGKQCLDQKDSHDIGFDPERPVKFVLNMGKKLKGDDDDDEEEKIQESR